MTVQHPASVDCVIHGKWVIPLQSESDTQSGPQTVLDNASVVVNQGKILAICSHTQAKQNYQARQTFSLNHHVLLPGLINSHCHAPMSLFRGYADDLDLMTWLQQHIWPAEGRWVSPEFARAGTRLAIAEMLLGGVTCFTDMYFYPDVVAQTAIEAGMRTHIASPVLDFPTPWAQNAQEYLDKAVQVWKDFKNQPLVTVGFGPHAPYTVSDSPLEKIAALAEELDTFIQIHLHETQGEVTNAEKELGQRPIQRLYDLNFLSRRVQAVHMTQVTDAELGLLAERDVSVVHCPESNLKLASGFCPVARLQQAGLKVALGTDGAASNNNLDMLGEIQTAALLAKAVAGDAQALPAHAALKLASRALTLGGDADIIAIDLHAANTLPVYNPLSQVVYAANSSQVSHVWVAGQCLVDERRLTTLDYEEILRQTVEWGRRIHKG